MISFPMGSGACDDIRAALDPRIDALSASLWTWTCVENVEARRGLGKRGDFGMDSKALRPLHT